MTIHILLVEDNDMLREVFTTRLEIEGFKITVAENGRDAIDFAFSQNPDLILMDISLPYISGMEAVGRIRQREQEANEGRHVPIIALSAHASADDLANGLEAGCNDYMTKPVDFPMLIEKIYQLLGKS